jgi:hypothetical protein
VKAQIRLVPPEDGEEKAQDEAPRRAQVVVTELNTRSGGKKASAKKE